MGGNTVFRLDDARPIQHIELPDDLPGKLNVGDLVFPTGTSDALQNVMSQPG
jgi:hypothetical protein